MTRWFAILLTSVSLSILAINAVGIRPRGVAVRTWRNIGFLATTAACAVVMVAMTMYAILTNSVPDWLPVSGLVLFLIGGIGWRIFTPGKTALQTRDNNMMHANPPTTRVLSNEHCGRLVISSVFRRF